jgi:hypothetical protein
MPQDLVTVYHKATGTSCRMHAIDAAEALAQGEYAMTLPGPARQSAPVDSRQAATPEAPPAQADRETGHGHEAEAARSPHRPGRER